MALLATGSFSVFKLPTDANKTNLISWREFWTEGQGGVVSGWNSAAYQTTAAENARGMGLNPWGLKDLIWSMVPTASASSAWHGGAMGIALQAPYDRGQTYRFSLFVRKNNNYSTFYLGCNTVITASTGALNTNPYFLASSMGSMAGGVWYLWVGYIFSEGMTLQEIRGQVEKGGIYDMSGSRIVNVSDSQLYTANPTGLPTFRFGLNGSAFATGVEVDVYDPRVEVCDGSEHSIEELVKLKVGALIDDKVATYDTSVQSRFASTDAKIVAEVTKAVSYKNYIANSLFNHPVTPLQGWGTSATGVTLSVGTMVRQAGSTEYKTLRILQSTAGAAGVAANFTQVNTLDNVVLSPASFSIWVYPLANSTMYWRLGSIGSPCIGSALLTANVWNEVKVSNRLNWTSGGVFAFSFSYSGSYYHIANPFLEQSSVAHSFVPSLQDAYTGLQVSDGKIRQLATEADNLTGRVDTAEQKITPTAITNTVTSRKNLLLNSGTRKSGTGYNVGYFDASRDFVPGEQLTITIKGDIPGGTKLFGVWFNSGSLGGYSVPKIETDLYSRTITVPVGTNTRKVGIYLIGNQSAGDSWSFEWLKMEAGNIRTDWTPSPEDTNVLYTQARQTADAIEFSVVKNDEVIAKINASTEGVRLVGQKINLTGAKSEKTEVDVHGTLTADDAQINGTISANTGHIGDVQLFGGVMIGGRTIGGVRSTDVIYTPDILPPYSAVKSNGITGLPSNIRVTLSRGMNRISVGALSTMTDGVTYSYTMPRFTLDRTRTIYVNGAIAFSMTLNQHVYNTAGVNGYNFNSVRTPGMSYRSSVSGAVPATGFIEAPFGFNSNLGATALKLLKYTHSVELWQYNHGASDTRVASNGTLLFGNTSGRSTVAGQYYFVIKITLNRTANTDNCKPTGSFDPGAVHGTGTPKVTVVNLINANVSNVTIDMDLNSVTGEVVRGVQYHQPKTENFALLGKDGLLINQPISTGSTKSTSMLYLGADGWMGDFGAAKMRGDASGLQVLVSGQWRPVITSLEGGSLPFHTHTKAEVTNFPTSMPASDVSPWAKAAAKPTYTWTEVTGKPTAFTPAAHNHSWANITTGKPTTLAGYGITDASDIYHGHAQYYSNAQSRPAGTVLAAPATAAGIADFRALVASDLPSHTHAYAPTSHTHPLSAITDLHASWDAVLKVAPAYAPTSHTHPLSAITDLHASWDAVLKVAPAYAAASHAHAWAAITGKPTAYAPAAHGHQFEDISNTYGLGTRCIDIGGLDLNTTRETGFFSGVFVAGGPAEYTDYNSLPMYLINLRGSRADTAVQLASYAGYLFIREKTNHSSTGVGVWEPWEKFYTTINKPTYSDVGAAAASHAHAWAAITGKPTAFTPAAHNHVMAQLTNIASGTCSTAAATAAKTLAASGFVLATGAVAFVRFTLGNTAANPTMNVNGTAAKPIYYNGQAVAADLINANNNLAMVYDGTNWNITGTVEFSGIINGLTPGASSLTGTSNYAARADHTHSIPTYPTLSSLGAAHYLHTHPGEDILTSVPYSDSATKLETSRTLWGKPFNGTANVSGAMTGVTSIDFSTYLYGATRHLISPNGGVLNGAASVTGALTITLPPNIGQTMLSMWIDVYNYVTGTSFSVHCGGYTYTNNTWVNPFALVVGATHTVRFGHTGTQFTIHVGNVNSIWKYPQVLVRDVLTGFSSTPAGWRNAIAVSVATAYSGTIHSTISRYALTSSSISSFAAASHAHAWAAITGKPTAFTPAAHNHSWANITSGKPTTLGGYGITDAAAKAHTHGDGNWNTAIGASALSGIGDSSVNNCVIGYLAMASAALNCSQNSVIGREALYSLTNGNYNMVFGHAAMYGVASGGNNIAIGGTSGRYTNAGGIISSVNDSIFIGGDSRAYASGGTNEIAIGFASRGMGSHTAVVGNGSITKTSLQGSVFIKYSTDEARVMTNYAALNVKGDVRYTGNSASSSDARIKSAIRPYEFNKSSFLAVRCRTYIKRATGKTESGFVAQELMQHYPELVFTDNPNEFAVNYIGMIVPTVSAVQEHERRLQKLEQEISRIKKLLTN